MRRNVTGTGLTMDKTIRWIFALAVLLLFAYALGQFLGVKRDLQDAQEYLAQLERVAMQLAEENNALKRGIAEAGASDPGDVSHGGLSGQEQESLDQGTEKGSAWIW